MFMHILLNYHILFVFLYYSFLESYKNNNFHFIRLVLAVLTIFRQVRGSIRFTAILC